MAALLLAACSGDDAAETTVPLTTVAPVETDAPSTTAPPTTEPLATTAPSTDPPLAEGWEVDTDDCDDPDAADRSDRGHGQPRLGHAVDRRCRPGVRARQGGFRGVHRLRPRAGALRGLRRHQPDHRRRSVRRRTHTRRRRGEHRRGRPPVRGHHRHAQQRRGPRHAERRVHPAAERADRLADVGRSRRLPVDHRPAGAVQRRGEGVRLADRRPCIRRVPASACSTSTTTSVAPTPRHSTRSPTTSTSTSSTSRRSRRPTPTRRPRRSPAWPT